MTAQIVSKWTELGTGKVHYLEAGPADGVAVVPSMSGRYAFSLLVARPELLAGFVAVAPVGISAYAQRLRDISVPILAIWGENDAVVPATEADRLVGEAAKAKKVVVVGAGHATYLDDPAAFHEALLEFLSAVRAPTAWENLI